MTNSHQVLAILAPRFGAVSETFVRRHIAAICPGQTVVATRDLLNPDWGVSTPLLRLKTYPDNLAGLCRLIDGLWRYDQRSRALHTFLQEHRVSVVMGEWLNFTALWSPVMHDLGIRCFGHAHGYDVTKKAFRSPRNRLLYRRLHAIDGVITVSEINRERLITNIGLDPAKVHVVPCGVVIPSLPASRVEDDRQIVCLSVGRMVEKKSPLHTLRAFHLAYRAQPNLRMEFIGDGPLRAACEQYCTEHALEGVVTFHGAQPPEFVAERLALAGVFLLHSVCARNGDEEGLPVSILEAMAHALPVISTRHAGIPDAVVDGTTGYLVDEHDWRGMGERLLALATQPDLRQAFGQTGRARAIERFSAEYESQRLREILFGNAG